MQKILLFAETFSKGMRTLYGFILLASFLLNIGCNEQKPEIPNDAEIRMKTELGDVYLKLFDETPVHKNNFLKLAEEGFFDGMAFHRIVNQFVVQAGDPRTKDAFPPVDTAQENDAGYTLPAEIVDAYAHTYGALGAARYGDEENPERRSSGSQFYIVTGRKVSTTSLDSMEEDRTGVMLDTLYQEYKRNLDSLEFEGTFVEFQKKKGFVDFKYSKAQRQTYLNRGGAMNLDGTYTVFGKVLSGMDVVEEIEITPANSQGMPIKPVRIISMQVLTPQKEN